MMGETRAKSGCVSVRSVHTRDGVLLVRFLVPLLLGSLPVR
jgi:hypothetical protein